MNKIKRLFILTAFLLITAQVAFSQIIDPYSPSDALDSLYSSLGHLDTLFFHDDNGQLVEYRDEFTSIKFRSGQFVQLNMGAFELKPTETSYQLDLRGNGNQKYVFFPDTLDIKVKLPDSREFSLLKETRIHGREMEPWRITEGYKLTFKNILEFDSIKISPEVDKSFYRITSTWVNNNTDIDMNMTKRYLYESKFGNFVFFKADTYKMAIFTNKEGVIDFIGIEFKEKYYLWFNFRQKRKTEKLYNIEYILTFDQGENAHPLYVPYKLFSYKRSGRMKENKLHLDE